jgi:hypothetical protein
MDARFTLRTLFALSLSALGLAANAQSPTQPLQQPNISSRAIADYDHLPLSFQPNQGQTSKEVQWLARGSEYTLFLSGPNAVLELNKITPEQKNSADLIHLRPTIQSTAVRMDLVGAKAPEHESGEEPQPGKANYFTGRDSSKWQRNVPLYGKVRMEKIYPGIDLTYYGTNGRLEYDFIVAPGAEPSAIQMKFDGAMPKLSSDGDLLLPVDGSEVRFNKPVVYQIKNGARQPVEGSFTIADNREVSFNLGVYDKSRELVIDPTLLFAGTLGTGNQQTIANGMAVDAAGEIILTGITNDLTFPVTSGALQPSCTNYSPVATANGFKRCGASSASSGFVTKISADGTSLIYSTYLHGPSGDEYGQSVAVDSTGATDIFGMTASNDFPITSDAYQTICQPYYSSGSTISPACDGYFAGGGTEWVVQGPTLFLVKLSADGSTINYGTFFGGTDGTFPVAMTLDSSNNMYFISYLQDVRSADSLYPNSSSIPFPTTTGAYQKLGNNTQGVTLSKLSADGHTLLYSTVLAPTGSGYFPQAIPYALAVGPDGMAYVAGNTNATSFPITTGALKTSCDGNNSGNCQGSFPFITAFDTTKAGSASLVYSTFLGGDAVPGSNIPEQEILALAADSSNNIYATGYTYATDFPVTTGAYQTVCDPNDSGNRCDTAFVTKINPTGTAIIWSTFLDGNGGYGEASTGYGLTFDTKGRIYVYGNTNDPTFPQVNSLTSKNNGGNKLFFSVLSSNAKQLLFSTWLGQDTPANPVSQFPSTGGGFALDSAGNIYFSGYSADNGNFVTTDGTYATTATAGFNRTFFGKISPVLTPSATKLTIGPSPAYAGFPITFTAIVTSPAQTTPVPTGTVVFTNTLTTPATQLGTATVNETGTATFSTSSLIAGTYSITATYSGDTEYDPNTTMAQTLTVAAAPPTTPTKTALKASAASITSGGSVTFTSTVTGTSGTAAPTGTVTFLDGATSIGTGTLNTSGVATFTTTSLAVGSQSITASYAGDLYNGASVSTAVVVVVAAPVPGFAISLSSSSASIASGGSTTSTLTVTPDNGFSAATTFACSGLPANSTCTFAPASVTPNGKAITTTLTIATGVASTSASLDLKRGGSLSLLAGSGALLALLFWPGFMNRKQRTAWLRTLGMLLFAIVSMHSISGCGGGSSKSTPTPVGTSTPAGTSAITITATSGTLSKTTIFTLTVQ